MNIEQIVTAQHNFTYSDKKIDLAVGYGADENYVRCVAASIASICINNKLGLRFHIITDNFYDASIKKFEQMAKHYKIDIIIYVIEGDNFFSSLPTKSHFPLSIYFRYLLPLLLKSGKILYIDADIINLKPLTELVELDLADSVIAAVRDAEWMERKRCKILGLASEKYFNSGVMLIDIAKWNALKVFEGSMELLQTARTKYNYPDQDVLNIILQEKVRYLGRAYNCLDCNSLDKNQIILLHFAAHPKPWNIAWPISQACNDFNRNIYAEYEALTPWHDEPLCLPRNDKERKIYAKCLFRKHEYIDSLRWYLRYIEGKIR